MSCHAWCSMWNSHNTNRRTHKFCRSRLSSLITAERIWGPAAKCLPGMGEALGLNPNTAKQLQRSFILGDFITSFLGFFLIRKNFWADEAWRQRDYHPMYFYIHCLKRTSHAFCGSNHFRLDFSFSLLLCLVLGAIGHLLSPHDTRSVSVQQSIADLAQWAKGVF